MEASASVIMGMKTNKVAKMKFHKDEKISFR